MKPQREYYCHNCETRYGIDLDGKKFNHSVSLPKQKRHGKQIHPELKKGGLRTCSPCRKKIN